MKILVVDDEVQRTSAKFFEREEFLKAIHELIGEY